MGALNLRLPDDLLVRLDEEARRAGVARSEVARIAILEFLDRKERERFLSALVAAAKAAYSDPRIRKEALEMAEEALPLGNEALDLAEHASARRGPAPRLGANRRRR